MFGGRALARLLNTYGSKYGIDNINDLVEGMLQKEIIQEHQ